MSDMTEEEWEGVAKALVSGGLRDYINGMLRKRTEDILPRLISRDNLRLLRQAFDPLLRIEESDIDGYFVGVVDDGEVVEVVEGTEIDGVLYCICPLSGGGLVSVTVGDELIRNSGETFRIRAEARAYIKGLSAR